jgi:tRNA wybutosine-synthesizing protein 4
MHCLKWSRRKGWIRCIYGDSEQPAATYGASLMIAPYDGRADTVSRHGVIAGGLSADGLLSQAIWRFEVKNFSSQVSRRSDFTPSAI